MMAPPLSRPSVPAAFHGSVMQVFNMLLHLSSYYLLEKKKKKEVEKRENKAPGTRNKRTGFRRETQTHRRTEMTNRWPHLEVCGIVGSALGKEGSGTA